MSAVASDKFILATTHIRWCTGFYGFDEDHSVGFLAHFDWPLSESAIGKMFAELERLVGGRPRIKCFVVGGWKYSGYSELVRFLIKKRIDALKDDGWDIQYLPECFSNEISDLQIRYWTMPIQFNIKSGQLSPYYRHKTLRKKRMPLDKAFRLGAQRRSTDED